jgi:hypothetical protein
MDDDTNTAFKEYFVQCRPFLQNTIVIGMGDIWLGSRAYKIGLIDCIITKGMNIYMNLYIMIMHGLLN